MIKNKSKIIIGFTIILFIIGFCTYAKASSFTFIAKAQKEIVSPGDEVIIDLDISNIDARTEGINVVETSLEYDENIFETIEFEKQNNWNIEYNNISNHSKKGKLLFVKMTSGVKQDEQIGRIKLKLRQNLGEMETEIKLKQVTSNDGKELILEGDRIIKIKIVKNSNNEGKNEVSSKDDDNIDMPETGQQRIIYIILGIIIIVCIIILIYLKVRNKEKRKE